MKILTIIGNGFDLGHGLPTQFDNFISSNPKLYKNKYGVFQDENNSWNKIEQRYQQLLCQVVSERSWLDVTEEVDNIVSNYGFNEYGEVDYYNYSFEAWDDELNRIAKLIELLKQFELDFCAYLRTTCCDEAVLSKRPRRAILEILQQSSTIINFNYTHTIEALYGIKNVTHIHGDINNVIAIGTGAVDDAKESMLDSDYPTIKKFTHDKHGFAEMMAYYDEDMEGNIVENHFIRRFFDEVSASGAEKEAEVFSLLGKKCKDSLELRQKVIDELHEVKYDKVYIIGHSLGAADHSVLDAIRKDVTVICFFHKNEDRADKAEALSSMGFNYQLINDSDLF